MKISPLTHTAHPHLLLGKVFFQSFQLMTMKFTLMVLFASLLFTACKDDCKEANCNPHPEASLLIVDDQCNCTCRTRNNGTDPRGVVQFDGMHICVEPVGEDEMVFVGNKTENALLSCADEETLAYVLKIELNDEINEANGTYILSYEPNSNNFSHGQISIDSVNQEFSIFNSVLTQTGTFHFSDCGRSVFFRSRGMFLDNNDKLRLELDLYGESLDAFLEENLLGTEELEFDRLVF